MSQELYALGSERSARFVQSFLKHFLRSWKAASVDYPVPELSNDPLIVFQTDDEILKYLEHHPEATYGIYWNASDPAEIVQAMAFFTEDGQVIFGLAVWEDYSEQMLKELSLFVNAEYSRFGWEQRPPDTSKEFIAQCIQNQP